MNNKRVVVIGGGIAGLSAGCYARMCGYEVEVLEAHTLPGGLCTSWTRRGYTFDGCIHWLTGAREGSSFYPFWREVGALPGPELYDHDAFYSFVGEDGRTFTLWSDADRLAEHIAELSPVDAAAGRALADDIKKLAAAAPIPMHKAASLMSMWDKARMYWGILPIMPLFGRYASQRLSDFAAGFQDPLIRFGLANSVRAPECMATALLFTMADLHAQRSAYPIGGSLAFARRIVARLESLGGTLRMGARVAEILVEDGTAVGVRLAAGEEIRADHVVTACDLRVVLDHLIDVPCDASAFERLFDECATWRSCVLVSLAFSKPLEDPPDCIGETHVYDEPREIGPFSYDLATIKHYAHDPTLAPEGHSIVGVMIDAPRGLFEDLRRGDREAYEHLKAQICHEAVAMVEARYPELAGALEASDVATPATFERYTSNTWGAYMSWVETPENTSFVRDLQQTLPGVKNLWLSGMWLAAPGGLPSALKSGRDAVQLLCDADGRAFTPGVPASPDSAAPGRERSIEYSIP